MNSQPDHPGRLIKEILDQSETSLREASRILRISHSHLSDIVNGRYRVTPKIAIRLGKMFESDPEIWVIRQMNYDIFVEKQNNNEIAGNHFLDLLRIAYDLKK